MHLKKNHIFSGELHTILIKDADKEELDDPTFNLWKLNLQKELPIFWESMDETIKPKHKFSHSS